MSAPLVISHAACRGCAPENTLAGVRAALATGADAVELDLRSTSDGELILMHDPTVDRTTDGRGAVSGLSLAQINGLNAGGTGFDGRFFGEPVPTLLEAIELIHGRCRMVVEVKEPGITERVLAVLRSHDALGWSMVWSFDLETVGQVRRLHPSLPAALLVSSLPENIGRLFESVLLRDLGALAVHFELVDAALVRAAALRGLSVYAWTANRPADQRRLAAAGVRGIVTDEPALLRQTLAAR